MFIYQSWVNLIKKEISKFSIDALALFLIVSFGGTKSQQRAIAYSKDGKRIFLFGVYGILGTIGGIYGIAHWIGNFVRPR